MSRSKENKELLELGSKRRSGQLLSEYIRAIGTETTELVDVVVDPDTKERRLVTKAEALARDIWKKALEEEDPKLQLDYRKLLYDRIEGKPSAGGKDEDEQKGMSVPDRVSKQNRDRLNKIIS
jgi:hypothetical protein